MDNLINYTLLLKKLQRNNLTEEFQTVDDGSIDLYHSLVKEAADRTTSHARSLDIKEELRQIRRIRKESIRF